MLVVSFRLNRSDDLTPSKLVLIVCSFVVLLQNYTRVRKVGASENVFSPTFSVCASLLARTCYSVDVVTSCLSDTVFFCRLLFCTKIKPLVCFSLLNLLLYRVPLVYYAVLVLLIDRTVTYS